MVGCNWKIEMAMMVILMEITISDSSNVNPRSRLSAWDVMVDFLPGYSMFKSLIGRPNLQPVSAPSPQPTMRRKS